VAPDRRGNNRLKTWPATLLSAGRNSLVMRYVTISGNDTYLDFKLIKGQTKANVSDVHLTASEAAGRIHNRY
jgi:hypothetical protein